MAPASIPSASSGSGLGVLAAGLSTQLSAQTMRTALDVGGLADPGLIRALDSIEIAGQRTASAAVLKIANDQIGTVLDLLA